MEEDFQSDRTSSGATGNHGSTCICILQDIRGNLCGAVDLDLRHRYADSATTVYRPTVC